MRTYHSPRFLAAVVAVLLVLSFIPTSEGPALETMLSRAGLEKINRSAHDHLTEQREQALKGFLLLSALKVGLAVLRSSEVGLILNVRIGDLAVAVYDYVNFGWKVLLAAVAYYYAAEYLLVLASAVNIWFLWTALIFFAAWLLTVDFSPASKRVRAVTARTATAAAVVAALLYAGLPLSLLSADWVSHHITGEPIRDANLFYEDMGESMPTLLDEAPGGEEMEGGSAVGTSSVTVPFPYDGADPSLAVKEKPSGAGDREGFFSSLAGGGKLRELKRYLEERSRALASAVLRQTAAYLFNIAIFPLIMVVALYLAGRYLVGLTNIR